MSGEPVQYDRIRQEHEGKDQVHGNKRRIQLQKHCDPTQDSFTDIASQEPSCQPNMLAPSGPGKDGSQKDHRDEYSDDGDEATVGELDPGVIRTWRYDTLACALGPRRATKTGLGYPHPATSSNEPYDRDHRCQRQAPKGGNAHVKEPHPSTFSHYGSLGQSSHSRGRHLAAPWPLFQENNLALSGGQPACHGAANLRVQGS
jgi:hypothetical protein